MNRIRDEQVRRNQASRDEWSRFGKHRDRVTNLIVAAGEPASSLIVFGAGNANDLDLARITAHFDRTTLVDLDPDALRDGIARQLATRAERVAALARDVGGLVDVLNRIDGASADEADWARVLDHAARGPQRADWGSAAVAVSACLLTQLIESAALALDPHDPRFVDLVRAIRSRHLRMLLDATRPAGTCLLITDVVSSATCPELDEWEDGDLSETIGRAIQSRNFFTGANPFVIAEQFQRDPLLAPRVASVELLRPWTWDFGPRRYAVCAIRARRRGRGGEVPPAEA